MARVLFSFAFCDKNHAVLGLKSTKHWGIHDTFFNSQGSFQLGQSDSTFLGDLQGAGCSYRLICGILVEKMVTVRAFSFLVYFAIWSKTTCALCTYVD